MLLGQKVRIFKPEIELANISIFKENLSIKNFNNEKGVNAWNGIEKVKNLSVLKR